MNYAQLTTLNAIDPLTKLGNKVQPLQRSSDAQIAALERVQFEQVNHDTAHRLAVTTPAAPVPKTEVPAVSVKSEVPVASPAKSEVPVTNQQLISMIRKAYLGNGMSPAEARAVMGGRRLGEVPDEELPAVLQAFKNWKR